MSEGKSTEIGIKAFLLKPVSINNLAKSVREVLDKEKDGKTE